MEAGSVYFLEAYWILQWSVLHLLGGGAPEAFLMKKKKRPHSEEHLQISVSIVIVDTKRRNLKSAPCLRSGLLATKMPRPFLACDGCATMSGYW